MLITDARARWLEIQLYDFAKDIYNIKRNTLDVYTLSDAISRMSGADPEIIKKTIRLLQVDRYYAPTEREYIVLAYDNGHTQTEIGKKMDKSKQAINDKLRRYKENFVPLPRFGIDVHYHLEKFITTYNKINPTGF